MIIIFMVIIFKVSLIIAFTIFRYNLCFVAVTYVSKNWVTKQLLPNCRQFVERHFPGGKYLRVLSVNTKLALLRYLLMYSIRSKMTAYETKPILFNHIQSFFLNPCIASLLPISPLAFKYGRRICSMKSSLKIFE